jgi:hypothetical protein
MELAKDLLSEVWVPLELEDMHPSCNYHLSNFGRIKSFQREKVDGTLLKGVEITGYKVFCYRMKDKRSKRLYIHRLVAKFFLEQKREEEEYVIHLDYQKGNNYHLNLQWATKQQKFAHANHNPKVIESRKIIRNAKLTESDVIRIKKALKRNKNRLKIIAKEFGISHTQINRIKNGENWAHIKID